VIEEPRHKKILVAPYFLEAMLQGKLHTCKSNAPKDLKIVSAVWNTNLEHLELVGWSSEWEVDRDMDDLDEFRIVLSVMPV
jgi:hypothetical protein